MYKCFFDIINMIGVLFMSRDIKKRVRDSEIEEAKSSNKKFFTTILILVVIILGLVLFLLYDYKVIFPPKEDKVITSNSKTTRHEDSYISLSVDNYNVYSLYNNVHDNITVGGDNYIYNNKKASVEDMSSEYKFKLAYNLYKNDIIKSDSDNNGVDTYISEDSVKSAYERLFGEGSYKRPESIKNGCDELVFDGVSKKFIGMSTDCSVVDDTIDIYDKILEVKRNSKELLITSAVVFSYGNNICKDVECNKILTENDGDYTRVKHFNDYIESNKDKLVQYTFKYSLSNDGFYYYTGFERTND